jgi:hypothetical protein
MPIDLTTYTLDELLNEMEYNDGTIPIDDIRAEIKRRATEINKLLNEIKI